tara:strand:+ start:18026 stop:18205 length:180 start_codon:yes stop_codon:yes gene_type:complete
MCTWAGLLTFGRRVLGDLVGPEYIWTKRGADRFGEKKKMFEEREERRRCGLGEGITFGR